MGHIKSALVKIFLCIFILQMSHAEEVKSSDSPSLSAQLTTTLKPLRPILWVVGINILALGISNLRADFIGCGLELCRLGEI